MKMNYRNFLLILFLTGMILYYPNTLLADSNDNHGRNSPTKLYCDKPSLPIFNNVEFKTKTQYDITYNATLGITQNHNLCYYMSGNIAHIYEIPYMPIKIELELYDNDYQNILLEQKTLTQKMDENFSISFNNLNAGIPYMIKIKSYFMNEFDNTEILSNGIYIKIDDPFWAESK